MRSAGAILANLIKEKKAKIGLRLAAKGKPVRSTPTFHLELAKYVRAVAESHRVRLVWPDNRLHCSLRSAA